MLISKIHPGDVVASKFPTPGHRERLEDLIVIKEDEIIRNGKRVKMVFFASDTFPGEELHASRTFLKVTQEGDPTQFFTPRNHPRAAQPIVAPGVTAQDEAEAIGDEVFFAGNSAEDIAMVRNQGLDVDDDNAPAPENDPNIAGNNTPAATNNGLFPGQKWGWDRLDRRKTAGIIDVDASFATGWSPLGKTYYEIFLYLFPMHWVEDVLLAETNSALRAIKCTPIELGEFECYIGLWLLMACTGKGFSKDAFWKPYDELTNPCPYNFNKYMSQTRFNLITRELRFTNATRPTFTDKFWQVRQLVKAWNDHMAAVFSSSWVICLDESMSIWTSRWTCPGWVFCPRKPHPQGNEYHSACCGKSGIMFVVEMVEGKDRPRELGVREYESDFGKTGGLLLRLLKTYFSTGRYVVLDSGFCVLIAILGLLKMGIYAGALIKKRRYWLTRVPGAAMDEYFSDKAVGEVDAIQGEDSDGTPYFIWGMKEPDYVMRIMSTGGGLTVDDTCKMTQRGSGNDRVTFQYAKPFDWHFRYRHLVDDHNNLRHTSPSIEETWVTTRWECRVFCFILAITEVNVFLTLKSFIFIGRQVNNLPNYLTFRKDLAWELINNPLRTKPQDDAAQLETLESRDHDIQSAPPHASAWRNRKWVCDAKQRNQQYTCKWPGCHVRTRNYCICTPGYWLCASHIVKHAMAEVKKEFMGN